MKVCSSLYAVAVLTVVVLGVGSSAQTRAVGAAATPPGATTAAATMAATSPAVTRPAPSLAEVLTSLHVGAEPQAQIQQIVAKLAADQKAWVREHKDELTRLRDEANEAAEDKDWKAYDAILSKQRALLLEKAPPPRAKHAAAQIAKQLPEPLAGAFVASIEPRPLPATESATQAATQAATQRAQIQAQVHDLAGALFRQASIHLAAREAGMFTPGDTGCKACHFHPIKHP